MTTVVGGRTDAASKMPSFLVLLTGTGPPTPTPSDIFVGFDTYGWPPVDEGNAWAGFGLKPLSPVIFTGPSTVTVPQLLGLSLGAAFAALTAVGLVGVQGAGSFSSITPFGLVADQTPAAFAMALAGSTVNFDLSLGPAPTGFATIQATIEALSAAGFVASPVFVYAYSNTVPDGFVISINPSPGANVPINTAIQLTVSLGPPNPVLSTTVPNFVGMEVVFAQQALTAAQLALNGITYVSLPEPTHVAYVIAQSVSAGSVVPLWTEVQLTVNSGAPQTYPGTGDQIVPPLP